MAKRITKATRTVTDKGRRITAISFPAFGLQWADPGPSEREQVRRFVVFLEDRRALYIPDDLEIESQVEHSVHAIREECTKLLQQLGEGAFGAIPVHAIRSACRRYHDDVNLSFRFFEGRHHDRGPRAGFFVALGALRAAVGQQFAHLASHYDLSIKGELADILPQPDDNA
jgi:hypothetical protein